MTVLSLANIYFGELPSAVVLLAVSTWLVGGASRYAAVLAGRSQGQVERATGIGLFAGVSLALLILISNEISHAL